MLCRLMSLPFPIESTRVPTIVFMEGMNGTDYVHGVLERVAQNEWREISTQTAAASGLPRRSKLRKGFC